MPNTGREWVHTVRRRHFFVPAVLFVCMANADAVVKCYCQWLAWHLCLLSVTSKSKLLFRANFIMCIVIFVIISFLRQSKYFLPDKNATKSSTKSSVWTRFSKVQKIPRFPEPRTGLVVRFGPSTRTLDRTSVRFRKVQVRTLVQNRTTAALFPWLRARTLHAFSTALLFEFQKNSFANTL